MKCHKVVTAKELRRVEAKSLQEGASEEEYIKRAAQGLFEELERFNQENNLQKSISLLVGPGNNGKDALELGHIAKLNGYEVHLGVHSASKVIIDGLFGSGFHGSLTSPYKEQVKLAHESGQKIISIDIPSGIQGDTGEALGIHIKADHVVAIGVFKVGHFFNEGLLAYQTISLISFGLEQRYEEEMIPSYLIPYDFQNSFPSHIKTEHKYQRGYLGLIAGSPGMEGAAGMAALSALKVGAGIVRLFMDETKQPLPLEIIRSDRNLDLFKKELPRLKALAIGPGLKAEDEPFIQQIFSLLEEHPLPLVIDAMALDFFHRSKKGKLKTILTPNGGEIKRLSPEDFIDQIVIEKGAITLVKIPNEKIPYLFYQGSVTLATAGTGDLLMGMIGGFLAQKVSMKNAALLGVYVHQKMGKNNQFFWPTATDFL